MVASNQVENPYYRAVGGQRGRGFGALAQVIGTTAIPFLRKYVVPAAKRVGADLLEFAVPEIAEVASGRKNFKTAAKNVGKQTLKKQLGEGSRRLKGGSKQRRFIPTKSTKQSSRSVAKRHFYKHLSLIMPNNSFRYQPFVAVSGNLGGKAPIVDDVLSSNEQEIYPTTSLDENFKEFEFQMDRNYYVDLRQSFLALKLKFVNGRDYDLYESKEKKKEHKDESVVFTETGDEEEEEEVARVTYVNNKMHSIFSNVEVYINNQQIYKSNGLYAHKSYISNNFKASISEYKGVLHCEGCDYEQDPEDVSNPLPDPFFTRRMKLLSRPDGFMLYGKLGIDFFSPSHLLSPYMKIRLRLTRARPSFYMISDNPNVSLGILDCSLYTRRIALKDDYH